MVHVTPINYSLITHDLGKKKNYFFNVKKKKIEKFHIYGNSNFHILENSVIEF